MKTMETEAGIFFISDQGILERFQPRQMDAHGHGEVNRLIIPEGVIKIGTGVLEMLTVKEEVRFPDSLRNIGTKLWEPAISWCRLPHVVIPPGVEEMTSFAFGKCELLSLRLPGGVRFVGGRHFKGSRIGTLYLPCSMGILQNREGSVLSGSQIRALRPAGTPQQGIEVAIFSNDLQVEQIVWYED